MIEISHSSSSVAAWRISAGEPDRATALTRTPDRLMLIDRGPTVCDGPSIEQFNLACLQLKSQGREVASHLRVMRAKVTHRLPRRSGTTFYRSRGKSDALPRYRQGRMMPDRLFSFRLVAYLVLEALGRYKARFSGAGRTGRLRCDSTIELDLVSDDPEQIRAHLRSLGWVFTWEMNPPEKKDPDAPRPTMAVHIERPYRVDLSVYPTIEVSHPDLRRGFSKVELEAVLAEWHAEEWEKFRAGKRDFRRHSPFVHPWG